MPKSDRTAGSSGPIPPAERVVPSAPPVADGLTGAGIPPRRSDRDRLRQAAEDLVASVAPTPPLSFDELTRYVGQILEQTGLDAAFAGLAAVILSNEVWRNALAAVPFERRMLLLPQCLRDMKACTAPIDEFGLLCRHCGRCVLDELITVAEELGYVTLVAEGSALVTGMIETGRIQAVVGVSCLPVLEKVFPYMEAAAIPGIAVPLLRDGCVNTSVDLDWVWGAIRLSRQDADRRTDLAALRRTAREWFAPEALDEIAGPARDETERIARDYLAESGKRWRPILTACAYRALRDETGDEIPPAVHRLAVAVECFHKASLIHDDIADDDPIRNGHPTLHERFGKPVALNVGDLLLGEGYRLIAECGLAPEATGEMLRVAADAHRRLCAGQGRELLWRRRRRVLTPAEVVDIFRLKTSPAFEVALRIGAIAADAGDGLVEALRRYSEAIGIAYQLRDDVEDLWGDVARPAGQTPSLVLALACRRAEGEDRELLEAVWVGRAAPADPDSPTGRRLAAALRHGKMDLLAGKLLERYKTRAIRCLQPIANAELKGLLRRVVGRVFADAAGMSCCREYQAGHDAGRSGGAGSAA